MSDLEILWAIRDTPKSELNLSEKGILSMLLACIGSNKFCWYSVESLSDICGISSRRLSPHLHSLEEKKFIHIDYPSRHARNKTNQYSLNIEKILSSKRRKSVDILSIGSPDESSSPDETSADPCDNSCDKKEEKNNYRRTKRPRSPDDSSGNRLTNRPTKNNNEDKHKEKNTNSSVVDFFTDEKAGSEEWLDEAHRQLRQNLVDLGVDEDDLEVVDENVG